MVYVQLFQLEWDVHGQYSKKRARPNRLAWTWYCMCAKHYCVTVKFHVRNIAGQHMAAHVSLMIVDWLLPADYAASSPQLHYPLQLLIYYKHGRAQNYGETQLCPLIFLNTLHTLLFQTRNTIQTSDNCTVNIRSQWYFLVHISI